MKITSVPGTGVPAGQDVAPARSMDKINRAKAIAAGVTPTEEQMQEAPIEQNIKKIQMTTQVSQNRHDFERPQEVPAAEPVQEESATNYNNEQASVTEETRPLSPQFAALAKAKRALQVKERELAQREEALKSQAPAEQVDWKAQLKSNPLSVLQEAGVTYDQLTEAILNNQNQPIDPQKLRNELKEELKKELLGEFGNRDQQAEKQVLGEIKREALALTANGEEYEAIRQARAQDDVVELIHRTWKQTGEVMDVSEAAQLVESQLIEEALPFAKIKKVQSRLTPPIEAPAAVQAAPKPNTRVMRTLTNRDNAAPTALDRRSRAIAAMNGTLKRG